MAEFQDSIEIEAPPQAVFEYLTTNEGMTAWMGQYADLDPTPGAGETVGRPHPGTGSGFPCLNPSSSRTEPEGHASTPPPTYKHP